MSEQKRKLAISYDPRNKMTPWEVWGDSDYGDDVYIGAFCRDGDAKHFLALEAEVAQLREGWATLTLQGQDIFTIAAERDRYKTLAQELHEALKAKLPTCEVRDCGLIPTYSYKDYDSDPQFACLQHRMEVFKWAFERAGTNPGYRRDLEKRWSLFEYHDDDDARAALAHYKEATQTLGSPPERLSQP